MYHKSLNILIQRYFSKFLLIDDFNSASVWKNFIGGVSSSGELFLSKLDVNITKGKKEYA